MQRFSLFLLLVVALVLLVACGDTPVATTPPQATQAATSAPTATKAPTHHSTPVPTAKELSTLFSASDGSVIAVNATANGDGTSNVAVDIQVKNPTQARVKHLNFELAQFFFSRTDINAVNFSFHADGYTGQNDPIAGAGGPAPAGWLGMDENQLWGAMAGVFDANLPA